MNEWANLLFLRIKSPQFFFSFSHGVGDAGTGGAGSRAMGKHSFFAFRLVGVRLWESVFSQPWFVSNSVFSWNRAEFEPGV